MSLLVLYDDLVLAHNVQEFVGNALIPAMESPARITAIKAALAPLPWIALHAVSCPPTTPPALADVMVAQTHGAGYLAHLQSIWAKFEAAQLVGPADCILAECFPHPRILGASEGPAAPSPAAEPHNLFAKHGFYSFDMSTGIGRGTWPAIRASAHIAVAAAVETFNRASSSSPSPSPPAHDTVVALCRPPGHHCTTDLAGGYCYVNNVVVVQHTLSFLHGRPTRCAVLDIDFHHGNGTQSVFYDRADVLYVSIHGADEYPYFTGRRSETGRGAGHGFTLNMPLAAGASAAEYTALLDEGLARVRAFAPEYVLVSLGFDTFAGDPLGSFDLRAENYRDIAQRVRACVKEVGAPAIIVLEGGYVVEHLGENMAAFLGGWTGES
ncbi:hypothetical protein TD95_005138 [Thielaviopsis punctulata]|uniref:Histone deacetylase domain-containing protein n=1 Tax=Thielaviopsis punctulata TaxID=72032 RepID=A0A0F4ZJG8_9PEZI|nr:hypothetical protein TD95_005138 [Thielaviopsis punctulata]